MDGRNPETTQTVIMTDDIFDACSSRSPGFQRTNTSYSIIPTVYTSDVEDGAEGRWMSLGDICITSPEASVHESQGLVSLSHLGWGQSR
jgi:hypothetical protein